MGHIDVTDAIGNPALLYELGQLGRNIHKFTGGFGVNSQRLKQLLPPPHLILAPVSIPRHRMVFLPYPVTLFTKSVSYTHLPGSPLAQAMLTIRSKTLRACSRFTSCPVRGLIRG